MKERSIYSVDKDLSGQYEWFYKAEIASGIMHNESVKFFEVDANRQRTAQDRPTWRCHAEAFIQPWDTTAAQ